MRSRQTGQVGSSKSDGVGGGAGLVVRCGGTEAAGRGTGEWDGENGSDLREGKTSGRG